MKKILSMGLATAMILSMGAVAFAKKETALYPIGAISADAYKFDSDVSAVDMSEPLDTVAYGETIYFPLLNTASETGQQEHVSAAQQLLAEKTGEFEAAAIQHSEAVTNAAQKSDALEAIRHLQTKAQAVKTAAEAWQNAVEDGAQEKSDYVAALSAFDLTLTPADSATEAMASAEALVSEKITAVTTAEAEEAAANDLVESMTTAKQVAEIAQGEAQNALHALQSTNFNYVYESEAINGIKLKAKWDEGNKYVNETGIVKKKITGIDTDQKYIYLISISLKDNDTMDANDLAGTIQLRKSGSFDYDEMELEVNIELSHPLAIESVITKDPQVFKEGEGFFGDTEEEFTFGSDSSSYFTINTVSQSKLLLAMNNDFDTTIANRYPVANLHFFNGNGATFNKTGTLYLSAPEGSFLYKVNAEGQLEKIANEKYDDTEEAFAIRTKTLGKYMISDIALMKKPK